MSDQKIIQVPKVKVELDGRIISDAKHEKLSLKERIDADEGLKSKRVMLTTVSLILLAVTFTGAVIEEANTFIFKIDFKHAEGLSILLALVILFLLIRYYSYARQYHDELTEIWKKDFMYDDRVNYREESGELSGLMEKKAPEGYKKSQYDYTHNDTHNDTHWSEFYTSKYLVLRYFEYIEFDPTNSFIDELHTINILKDIGVRAYFIVLKIEWKNRILGLIKCPENLDIRAPYLLGLTALLSLIHQAQLQSFLKWLLG